MKDFVHELEALGELLGADHDLAVLRGALNQRRNVLKRPREFEALIKLLGLRRHELICAAFDLAERICADTPAAFARKLSQKRKARHGLALKRKKFTAMLQSA